MLERKHKGILYLNLKRLANCIDDLKIILILHNEMRVLKYREDILRYDKTINNSFLGTAFSKIFCENSLIQKYFNALIN